MELFAKIVEYIQPVTIFIKQFMFHKVSHRVINMPLIKLNKILVSCHIFHKKLSRSSLQIFSTFKFSFFLTLLPCGEILLITNLVHVSLILNWFTYAIEYIWYITILFIIHLICVNNTYCSNFMVTSLSTVSRC